MLELAIERCLYGGIDLYTFKDLPLFGSVTYGLDTAECVPLEYGRASAYVVGGVGSFLILCLGSCTLVRHWLARECRFIDRERYGFE